MTAPPRYYLVTVISRFDAMELEPNLALPFPVSVAKKVDEPFLYCPVFTTREAAIAWNNGDDSRVLAMQEVER